jgi:hypothetical protein
LNIQKLLPLRSPLSLALNVLLLLWAPRAFGYALGTRTTGVVSGTSLANTGVVAFRTASGEFQVLQATRASGANDAADWVQRTCYLASPDQQICPVPPSTIIQNPNIELVNLAAVRSRLYAAWLVPAVPRGAPERLQIASSSSEGVVFGDPVDITVGALPLGALDAPAVADGGGFIAVARVLDAGHVAFTLIDPDDFAAAEARPDRRLVASQLQVAMVSPGSSITGGVAIATGSREPGRPGIMFATMMRPEPFPRSNVPCTYRVVVTSKYLNDLGNPGDFIGPASAVIDIPTRCNGDLTAPSSPALAVDVSGRLVVSWTQDDAVVTTVSNATWSAFGPQVGIGRGNPAVSGDQFPAAPKRPALFSLFGRVAAAWQGADVTTRPGPAGIPIGNDDGHINIQPAAVAIATNERPVVFIPGVAGSHLDLGNEQLWPGCPFETDHRRLEMEATPGGDYVSKNPVVAGDIIRSVNCTGVLARGLALLALVPVVGPTLAGLGGALLISGGVDATSVVYGPTISHLVGTRRLREYNHAGDPGRLTAAGCDVSQAGQRPKLFVFPYDWRLDIDKSALALRDYVGCIRRIYPGTEIDVVAHSMGGLVARRYILAGDHHVAHVATLGTPFLGAPRFPYVALSGDFGVPEILITHERVRNILAFAPGPHQLLPSRAYFELLNANYWLPLPPLAEAGFDLDGDGLSTEPFTDFPAFAGVVDRQFPAASRPASNTARFHDVAGQDDWRGDPGDSRPLYLHIVGIQQSARTTVQVRAEATANCTLNPPTPATPVGSLTCNPPKLNMVQVPGPGDGTVPLLSSSRLGGRFGSVENGQLVLDLAAAGSANLNNPDATVLPVLGSAFGDTEVDHGHLPTQPPFLDAAIDFFAMGEAPERRPSSLTLRPHFDLLANGFDSMVVRDPAGVRFDAAIEGPPPGVPLSTFPAGPNVTQLVGELSQPYDIRLRVRETRGALRLARGFGPGAQTAQIRHGDLPLRPGEVVQLTFGPDDAGTLRRDSDGDGTFDTIVAPTTSVSGAQASDVAPPTVHVALDEQRRLEVRARDTQSAVTRLVSSFDGVSYQPVGDPLDPALATSHQVHLLADDSAGNRQVAAATVIPLTATRNGQSGTTTDGRVTLGRVLPVAPPRLLEAVAGTVGNATATLTLRRAGGSITCLYRGDGPGGTPTTPLATALGRRLRFVSCSDGTTPGTVRPVDEVSLHLDGSVASAGTTRVDTVLTSEPEAGPLIQIAAPADRASFGSDDAFVVNVATAPGPAGVAVALMLSLDGTAVAQGQVVLARNLTVGAHRFIARAVDATGAVSELRTLFEVTAGTRAQAWEAGAYYVVGELVTFNGIVYQCRQTHTSTAATPPSAPALWMRPTPASGSPWTTQTNYPLGIRATYQSLTYECIQAHVSQPDWTPDRAPTLWRRR